MFAHHEEEEEVYPLTLIEIADAQHKDRELKAYFKKNAIMPQKDIGLHLIEDTKVLCKNGKVIIPTSLRHRAVSALGLLAAFKRSRLINDLPS